jgi:hypothetical protein
MPPLRRPLRPWFAICLALGLAHGEDAARAQSRTPVPVPPSRNSVEAPFIAIDDVPAVGATPRRPGYELIHHDTNWRLFGRR